MFFPLTSAGKKKKTKQKPILLSKISRLYYWTGIPGAPSMTSKQTEQPALDNHPKCMQVTPSRF